MNDILPRRRAARGARLTLFAAAATLLAACATTADVDRAKTSWRGATYDEVVTAWGVPVRQTALSDGAQVYTWLTEIGGGGGGASPASVGVFGGTGGAGIGAVIGVPFPGMGSGEPQHCERTLTFRDGRVAEQNWQGSPRLCGAFERGRS